jgi:beta-lactamase regulating signal transducer with metallopeptidase domain
VGETFIRHAILHGIIAAGFVEAVLAAWRIRSAAARLTFWVVALAVPFLVSPALLAAAPFRLDDHFAARWALLSLARWDDVQVAGIGVASGALALLILLGIALLLRDLVPFAAALWRESRDTAERGEVPADLAALVARQTARLQMKAPPIRVLHEDDPVLFVRGAGENVLVLSTGLLRRLRAEQVEAAITHELAHVRFRDASIGWLLMGARMAMFWNPAVQLVARAIAQEMEHRADAVAVRVAGAQAFASALDTLSAEDARLDSDNRWRAFRARLRSAHMSARSAALTAPPDEPAWLTARLVVVAAALGVISFFVV